MNPENGRKTYDSIEIPENLSELVQQTIASQNKEEIRMQHENQTKQETKTPARRPIWKGCAAAAAAVLLVGTVGLNTSPAFASEMSKMPVIGPLAQILTFRSFHGTEGDVDINLEIPDIQISTDASLPEKVNKEIQRIADDYLETAKTEFAEYKKTFFETGGTEEEWGSRKMDVYIDYDVKYCEDDILSLEFITAKGWVSAEEEHHFYNLDLKNDTNLTLEGLLGSDYISLCNESITAQIEERIAADDNAMFFGFGEDDGLIQGFTTITNDTPFYLNKDGNVVISFPKYSIAPGYMGIQEFVIQKSI